MISFKSLKTREIIELQESDVTAVRYVTPTKNGATRSTYAFKAEYNGERLTRFCSRQAWEDHDGPKAEIVKEAAPAA